MDKVKILVSLPTKHHVEIALDEVTGLQELGYQCGTFSYAAKSGYDSKIGRLIIVLKNAFKLIKITRQFHPDIVYFNSRLETLAVIRDYLTIRLVKTLYRKKVHFVIKSHGSDIELMEDKRYLLKNVILPYLKKNVAGWLFLSSEEKTKINQTGYFKPDKIFTTKNVVRVNQFYKDPDFKTRHGIAADHKVLLFVGRIISEKGIFEVVDAFSRIKEKHKTTFIIVGDGDGFEAVKERISELSIENVILTGFIPEQEVVAYYSNADILVFPTFFAEGFPMALFNSVGAGLAIITTQIRAASDFLSEPQNCLWVKPQNADDVYIKLDELLQSDDLINSMRVNNKQTAKQFSGQQIALELGAIFEQIVKQERHD
ncbi:glycosyltransferase involved in cell wall biosynthesis [Mucilaginibacter sp. UYP25]|uniref:glycosyltransferase family 4 protein n=1 Tax=unclassified Mucilaginibacter TaxID=2617802 RepID=UPI00339AF39B